MSAVHACSDPPFLLKTKTAKALYDQFASKQPIIDYHCHIDAKEIAQDIRYENITQIWLRHDHYKWRLMRAAGVEERLITGDATDREKFDAWAKTVGRAVGNPLFQWSRMELKRYFGYDGVLSEKTADQVWELTEVALRRKAMSAVGIIKQSNVELLCTTDDPIDTLVWHGQIDENPEIPFRVLPAFRPDRALNIEKPEFFEFVEQMEDACGHSIHSIEDYFRALRVRMEYFAEMGCRISDHGMERFDFEPAPRDTINRIFRKRLAVMAGTLPEEEIQQFKTAMMLFFAETASELKWTMQIHMGARRDNNTAMTQVLGPNSGFDCISGGDIIPSLSRFLDELNSGGKLPRMILYSLNSNDDALLDSLAACFGKDTESAWITHGAAWWFNDHEKGIREHLASLMSSGYFPAFVGMLTDSRSVLSYVRHDYFRRIVCDVLGQTVEDGLFPADSILLGEIVKDVCYRNTKRMFDA
ncbi:MAG: glucuronate isomerase [Clostridiaceae bacterium]|nr:glucuronate isomerase [Clostridiaceae bacterium]